MDSLPPVVSASHPLPTQAPLPVALAPLTPTFRTSSPRTRQCRPKPDKMVHKSTLTLTISITPIRPAMPRRPAIEVVYVSSIFELSVGRGTIDRTSLRALRVKRRFERSHQLAIIPSSSTVPVDHSIQSDGTIIPTSLPFSTLEVWDKRLVTQLPMSSLAGSTLLPNFHIR